MQQVFDLAFEHQSRHPGSCIVRLRLRAGDLAGVIPEALCFAFEAMKPNTPAERAELEIERVPALLHCRACDRDFEPFEFPSACHSCGAWQTEVQRGTELELARIEMESAEM